MISSELKTPVRTHLRDARRRRLRWIACLSMAAAFGCGEDAKTVGGLVVSLESDLAMPKDIDRVTLEIRQGDEDLAAYDELLGGDDKLLPQLYELAPTGSSEPVSIRAVGYRSDSARIERSALVTIPTEERALLRLSLHFLCDGTAEADGSSSCGDGNTCVGGQCQMALVSPDLPPYSSSAGAQSSETGADGGPQGACFEVLDCFRDSQPVDLDRKLCRFEAPELDESGRLNVALKLNALGEGVCDGDACWVVLDAGKEDGWRMVDDQIALPRGLCERIGDARDERFVVMASAACPTKPLGEPACGFSTDDLRADAEGPGAFGAPTNVISGACSAAPLQGCARCGTQRRECDFGEYSDWGACEDQGQCERDEVRPCEDGGLRVCGGDCAWTECLGKQCDGPLEESCGNCGTRTRACDNGVLGEWSACTGERACSADLKDSEACGDNGSGIRACGGMCEWGECFDDACGGEVPEEPCGSLCGTRSRTCNAGAWSEWGECTDEGACTPNETRSCQKGGTETCGGDCQWQAVCRGQQCDGAATRACGNCGVQTRTCDGNAGEWSDWSDCESQGSCEPNSARSCGVGGRQTCGGSCEWDGACTGQTCVGADSRGCDTSCGRQTRACDSDTGMWAAWSECGGPGVCEPGEKRECGANGERTCGADCQWEDACAGQKCEGDSTRGCERCGVQTRTCDPDEGRWDEWSDCSDVRTCMAGSEQGCQNQGKQRCNDSCEWGACTEQVCPGEAPRRGCGFCGTQTRGCNPNTGEWTGNWSECDQPEGACERGSMRSCEPDGTQLCSAECRWGECVPRVCEGTAPTRECGNCGIERRQCDEATLTWTGAWTRCEEPAGACMRGVTRECKNEGHETCGPSCAWGTCDDQKCPGEAPWETCARCGRRERTCNQDDFTWTGQWTECGGSPADACEPLATESCNEGTGMRTCNGSCQWEKCETNMCPGAAVPEPCGERCGMQIPECDPVRGTWTGPPASGCVERDDACTRGMVRECSIGNDQTGRQTCGDGCAWGDCVPVPCEGEAPIVECSAQCGTGPATCVNGTWTGPVAMCTEPRNACMRGMVRECSTGEGQAGRETCGDGCAWGDCVPVPCEGEAPIVECSAQCGTGPATCVNGTWTGPVAMCTEPRDACMPLTNRQCSLGEAAGMGTEACGANCQWTGRCVAVECEGPAPTVACGERCGTGLATCVNGAWTGPVAVCNEAEGACTPNAPRTCSAGEGVAGTELCASTCRWSDVCTPNTRPCTGEAPREECPCGTAPRTCDTSLGTWTGPLGPCEPAEGSCTAGETTTEGCTGGRVSTCVECAFGECACPDGQQLCDGTCTTGECSAPDAGGGDTPPDAGMSDPGDGMPEMPGDGMPEMPDPPPTDPPPTDPPPMDPPPMDPPPMDPPPADPPPMDPPPMDPPPMDPPPADPPPMDPPPADPPPADPPPMDPPPTEPPPEEPPPEEPPPEEPPPEEPPPEEPPPEEPEPEEPEPEEPPPEEPEPEEPAPEEPPPEEPAPMEPPPEEPAPEEPPPEEPPPADEGMSEPEPPPADEGMSEPEPPPADEGMSEPEAPPADEGMSEPEAPFRAGVSAPNANAARPQPADARRSTPPRRAGRSRASRPTPALAPQASSGSISSASAQASPPRTRTSANRPPRRSQNARPPR